MSKIITHLWFDNQAEEAANYYVETFKNAKLGEIARYPEAAEAVAGKPAGSVMTVEFEIEGMPFVALNGGRLDGFVFTGATSFLINCDTQDEIDHLWSRLSAVPGAEQCGWCTDKFGITWQVVPTILGELMSNPDKVEKVTAAFMQMKKFDIEALKKAGE